jgi:hypothetical protein
VVRASDTCALSRSGEGASGLVIDKGEEWCGGDAVEGRQALTRMGLSAPIWLCGFEQGHSSRARASVEASRGRRER